MHSSEIATRKSKTHHPVMTISVVVSLVMIALAEAGGDRLLSAVALAIPLLAGSGFLLLRYRSNNQQLTIPWTLLALLAFVLYRQISILAAPQSQFAILGALNDAYILLVFCLTLLLLSCVLTAESMENGLLWATGLFAAFNLPSVVQWWLGWTQISGNLLSLPPTSFRLPGALLAHANFEAAFLNLLIPLVFVRMLVTRSTLRRAAWGALLLEFGFIEFLSSSRGAWLAISFSLLLTALLIWRTRAGSPAAMKHDIRARLTLRSLGRAILVLVPLLYVGSRLLQWQARHPSHTALGSSRATIWGIGLDFILRSPVFGNGPGSFHYLSVAEAGIPPGFYVVHAHNLLIQIAAEGGLLGLVLLGLLGLTALFAWIAAWKGADKASRYRLAAYGGGLLTSLIHGMADFPFDMLIYSLVVIILLALIETMNPARHPIRLRVIQVVPVLMLGTLLFAAVQVWNARGDAEFEEARQRALHGDWTTASSETCLLADSQPSNTFFNFQCALALAELSSQDGSQLLHEAITRYRYALEDDPYWPVHWANLGMLEASIGELDHAVQDMSTAADLATRNARFPFIAGWLLRESGNPELSEGYLRRAILADPWILRSSFFNSGVGRSTSEAASPLIGFSHDHLRLTWEGWLALDAQEYGRAQSRFLAAIDENPFEGEAHAGLALVLHRLGEDRGIVESELKLALFYAPESYIVQNTAGLLALSNADPETAAGFFWNMYGVIARENLSKKYYNSTYRQTGFPIDTVPQMPAAPLPDEVYLHLAWLADYFRQNGDTTNADQVANWLLIQARFANPTDFDR